MCTRDSDGQTARVNRTEGLRLRRCGNNHENAHESDGQSTRINRNESLRQCGVYAVLLSECDWRPARIEPYWTSATNADKMQVDGPPRAV